ncbi:SelT/SelW/SelH family protein [Demequina sp. NBRC 110056]|uniref:SelT/SelW/SelH family protein n=1 Tax=Demequina sp. NBRC 110056 TaxID=1570345 RepID=UPI00190EC5D2|nr:Rdx family protein [Demequina sp. NBRC 110056]
MQIEIEYCVPCGYLDRALDAQRTLLSTFGQGLGGVTLKPGDKGVFTFRADDEVIYSKPDEYDITTIVETVKARL